MPFLVSKLACLAMQFPQVAWAATGFAFYTDSARLTCSTLEKQDWANYPWGSQPRTKEGGLQQ